MPIKYVKLISRDMVKAEPNALFVFGDNVARVGFGGQAASMRGEPNTIGVATKVAPGTKTADYFTDCTEHRDVLLADLRRVTEALANDATIYVPFDGLGTGLSQLPKRAPKLAQMLVDRFRLMHGETCPWPDVIDATDDGSLRAYKGFSASLACRDFQYELGKTYSMDGNVTACNRGFHACGSPLDVLQYYAPNQSRYAEVLLSGAKSFHTSDTKVASAEITLKAELRVPELVARAVKWVFDRAIPEGTSATGDQGAASATGVRGAASATGVRGAASATGVRGAASATGDQGVASATGDQGAASATGVRGAASATGVRGAASATGYQGAASATGYQGAASATGVRGAASATGDQGAASATGIRGAASATGYQGAASATGVRGAASATGDQGAASATGIRGAASATGDQGVASATGDQGAASATGVRGAASATGVRGAASATGYQGAASATGYQGAASATGVRGAASATGDQGAASATGVRGAASATGIRGKVRGAAGNALFLTYRDTNWNIVHVWAGVAGRNDIKADTWYRLDDTGKPYEVA